MQQVAANKTDLAALPFSATSTAKAVGNGLDSHSQGQNSEAFSSLYQEAKSGGRDFVLNENAKRRVKDSDRYHTDLPRNDDRQNKVDQAPSQNVTEAESSSLKTKDIDKEKDVISQNNEASKPGKDLKPQQGDSPTVKRITEKELSIGTDGKREKSAPIVGEPVSPIVMPMEDVGDETDWVAFVDGVANGTNAKFSSVFEGQKSLAEGKAGLMNSVKNQSMTEAGLDETSGSIHSVLTGLIPQLQSSGDETEIADISEKLSALREILNKEFAGGSISELRASRDIVSQNKEVSLSELIAEFSGISQSTGQISGAEMTEQDLRLLEETENLKQTENQLILSLVQDEFAKLDDQSRYKKAPIDFSNEVVDNKLNLGYPGGDQDELRFELNSAELERFSSALSDDGKEVFINWIDQIKGGLKSATDAEVSANSLWFNDYEKELGELSPLKNIKNRNPSEDTKVSGNQSILATENEIITLGALLSKHDVEALSALKLSEGNTSLEKTSAAIDLINMANSLLSKDISDPQELLDVDGEYLSKILKNDDVLTKLGEEQLNTLQRIDSINLGKQEFPNRDIGKAEAVSPATLGDALASNSEQQLNTLQRIGSINLGTQEFPNRDIGKAEAVSPATLGDALASSSEQQLNTLQRIDSINLGKQESPNLGTGKAEAANPSILSDALARSFEDPLVTIEGEEPDDAEQNSFIVSSKTIPGALGKEVTSSIDGSGKTKGNSASSIKSEGVAMSALNTPEEQNESLLMAISKLSPESAQKATEALAERMVALVPNSQQQQAVKSNIMAGMNEFQKQVEQGHQPGIDLSAIVADAAKEASLSAEVSSTLNARVETQAGQFMQLMTNAQNSIQQMVQQQFTQADAAINENNQIRSESSKSQQQFDGFDKAVNIHKPEGQQQLGEKIRWMVNARNTMAEIRLDPPELGSMQVRVNVQGEAASVSFVVQSQQAKDALAESMPKLRDMLSEQGIELGDAQVRKDNSSNSESGQQLAGQNVNSGNQRSENDAEFDNGHVIEQAVTREAKGGIDFYA